MNWECINYILGWAEIFQIIGMACQAQFRIQLGMVPLTKNFRSLGCVTAVRRAPKGFDKRYIRSNFQSCH